MVLSHQTWQSVFGGASDIVGRAITLDHARYTVIGVMPQGFQFPIQKPEPALWTSLAEDASDQEPMTGQRGRRSAGRGGPA